MEEIYSEVSKDQMEVGMLPKNIERIVATESMLGDYEVMPAKLDIIFDENKPDQ